MLTTLLTLLILLIVLALIAWGARAVLTGLGAPAWLLQVVVVVFLIVAILIVAQAFGLVPASLR